MELSKIRKQFYNFYFLGGHFVTKTSLLFCNQPKYLEMTYFKKKNFTSQKG